MKNNSVPVPAPEILEPKANDLLEVTPIELELDEETIEILLEDRISTGG